MSLARRGCQELEGFDGAGSEGVILGFRDERWRVARGLSPPLWSADEVWTASAEEAESGNAAAVGW